MTFGLHAALPRGQEGAAAPRQKAHAALLGMAVCALMLLAVSFSGCASQQQKSQPVTIALENWPPEWYHYVAQDNGYYSQLGVDVELLKFDDYDASLSAFVANKSIGCISASGNDLFNLRENGVKTKFVLLSDRSDGADAIVAGGNITSIEELAGKRIGVEGFNSFSNLFVVEMLQKHNLDETDVELYDIKVPDMPRAIEEGRLDAGHMYEPYTTEALSMGMAKIGDSNELPSGLIFTGLACRESLLRERPDEVQKMVDAWFLAKRFERENPELAHAMMANANRVSREELETGLAGNYLYGLKENQEAMSGGGQGTAIWSLDIMNEFLFERGQLSGSVRPDELVDARFVQGAKDGGFAWQK